MAEALRFVYITTETADDARQIGATLLQERLAACINIVDGMESMYWWQDEIESATECILIAKTTLPNVEALTSRVKELHDYTCPCVMTLPINSDEGNPDYLRWLRNEVKK